LLAVGASLLAIEFGGASLAGKLLQGGDRPELWERWFHRE